MNLPEPITAVPAHVIDRIHRIVDVEDVMPTHTNISNLVAALLLLDKPPDDSLYYQVIGHVVFGDALLAEHEDALCSIVFALKDI